MHAVATSPDDLAFGTAARDATNSALSVCYKAKKKLLYRSSVSSKARRYRDFIRKNSPNPNEFAPFAFNRLMRPDDHATKSRSSRALSFTQSLLRMTRQDRSLRSRFHRMTPH